jgi:AbrB family looped-hinge helix DNA binding protein
MQEPSTTKMSSKGQVVIPEEIRKRLELEPGMRFVVLGEGDVVILKKISAPDLSEFDSLIREARRQARSAGMKVSDVRKALKRVRERR